MHFIHLGIVACDRDHRRFHPSHTSGRWHRRLADQSLPPSQAMPDVHQDQLNHNQFTVFSAVVTALGGHDDKLFFLQYPDGNEKKILYNYLYEIQLSRVNGLSLLLHPDSLIPPPYVEQHIRPSVFSFSVYVCTLTY